MFDKDLGYLDKFFDKIEAHADSLDPQAGDELRDLIADERNRWARITALLGGAAAPSEPATKAPPSSGSEGQEAPEPVEPLTAKSERDEREKPARATVSRPAPPPPQGTWSRLTVGSLIKQ
jgi:hypothetical protein